LTEHREELRGGHTDPAAESQGGQLAALRRLVRGRAGNAEYDRRLVDAKCRLGSRVEIDQRGLQRVRVQYGTVPTEHASMERSVSCILRGMKEARVEPVLFGPIPDDGSKPWAGYHSSSRHEEPDGSEWFLELEWVLWAGRAEPISIKVAAAWSEGQPRPISVSDVRQLPIGTWIAEVRAGNELQARIVGEELMAQGLMTPVNAAELVEQWGPHRGRTSPTAELQRVADAYMAAFRMGEPVTDAVAKACGVSESTAGKRIMRARRAGLLPEVGKR
jgi:hypothetical protein